jgi:hypothetical protein
VRSNGKESSECDGVRELIPGHFLSASSGKAFFDFFERWRFTQEFLPGRLERDAE